MKKYLRAEISIEEFGDTLLVDFDYYPENDDVDVLYVRACPKGMDITPILSDSAYSNVYDACLEYTRED